MYKVRGLIAVALVTLVAVLLPIVALVIGITSFKIIGAPTFSFLDFVESWYALSLIATSLEFTLTHAALGVALALFYAWMIAKTDLPGKRFFEILPILGLTLPLEVKAFSWIFLLDPHVGMLNLLSISIFGRGAPTFDIYGMAGMIWVATIGAVPLAYLIILPAMKSLDPSLEEASKSAGRGTFRTFYSVTFRLLLPAIASAFMLSTISGLANFDYPYLIGQPGGVHTLSTEVYYWAEERSPPSFGSAGIISVVYVIMTAVAVGLYIWSTRKTYRFAVVTGASGRQAFHKLRRWKPLALLACFLIIFFEFILPFVALLLESSSNIYLTGNLNSIKFDFPQAYIQAMNIPNFWTSLSATFQFGIASAALLTVISALLSFATLKVKTRGARLTEFVTSIPLAFPGVVYGIALTWMFLVVPGLGRFYGTLLPLIFSLVVIRLPYTTRIVSANMVQVSNELEEASQISGKGFWRTFARVTLPLVKGGLINSFVYGLVDSLRELGGVIILSAPGAMAFTALLLDYYYSHNTVGNVLAAGSVMLVGLIVVLLVGLKVAEAILGIGGRRQRKRSEAAPENR
ncbi:MAG TPA: iron ABC transporter permease [Nitrososphaerales archaeon]|nr:iron ABC transporter permease [Nitrososphaerales archaeon]